VQYVSKFVYGCFSIQIIFVKIYLQQTLVKVAVV
jgi:hypothetical protein